MPVELLNDYIRAKRSGALASQPPLSHSTRKQSRDLAVRKLARPPPDFGNTDRPAAETNRRVKLLKRPSLREARQEGPDVLIQVRMADGDHGYPDRSLGWMPGKAKIRIDIRAIIPYHYIHEDHGGAR